MKEVDHILILIPGFPDGEEDINCVPYVQDLLRYILEARPDLRFSVVTLHYPYRTDKYHWYGVPVYPIGAANKRGPKRWRSRKRMEETVRSLVDNRTVIHSFWAGECAWIGERVAREKGVRHIVTCMGQDILRFENTNRLEACKDVVCVSGFHKMRLYAMNGSIEPHVIPWVSRIEFPEQETPAFDVLGVGSLIGLKNWDFLLDVAAHLPEMKFGLIGGGPMLPDLRRRVTNEGLSVEVVGEWPRSKVLACMSRSKIMLHPSNYESFGLVMQEARASGMEVFAQDLGMAHDDPAIHIIPEDPDAEQVAAEIRQALEQFQRQKAHFPPDDTVAAYLQLYQVGGVSKS